MNMNMNIRNSMISEKFKKHQEISEYLLKACECLRKRISPLVQHLLIPKNKNKNNNKVILKTSSTTLLAVKMKKVT